MIAWILSGWIHLIIGIFLGWAYRPAFAVTVVDFVWQPIKRLLGAIWTKIGGK